MHLEISFSESTTRKREKGTEVQSYGTSVRQKNNLENDRFFELVQGRVKL
jgi:hypothetical protein